MGLSSGSALTLSYLPSSLGLRPSPPGSAVLGGCCPAPAGPLRLRLARPRYLALGRGPASRGCARIVLGFRPFWEASPCHGRFSRAYPRSPSVLGGAALPRSVSPARLVPGRWGPRCILPSPPFSPSARSPSPRSLSLRPSFVALTFPCPSTVIDVHVLGKEGINTLRVAPLKPSCTFVASRAARWRLRCKLVCLRSSSATCMA